MTELVEDISKALKFVLDNSKEQLQQTQNQESQQQQEQQEQSADLEGSKTDCESIEEELEEEREDLQQQFGMKQSPKDTQEKEELTDEYQK